MSTSELVIWWVIVFVGIGGSAVCSGLEVGLYSVNRVLVQIRAAGSGRSSKRARVLEHQIQNPASTLTALLVWNNIFNYVGTLAMTTLITLLGLGDIQVMMVQIVILTPVLLIFAETTPKEVFRSHSAYLMERFVYITWILRSVMIWIPVVPTVLMLARVLSRAVGAEGSDSFTDSRQRVAELLKFGSMQMSDTQVTLIDRALELEHATVRMEMTPMRAAAVLRPEWSLDRARGFVKHRSYSRYPVVSSKGRVLGVLNGIDLYIHDQSGASRVEELMGEVIRIDAAKSVSEGLKALGQSKVRLGVVVAGGRDIGLVTRKDLIEPLIGELEAW